MNRIANLLGLALTLASIASASDPLKVTTVVSPKPHFAGQGVEVRVEVDSGAGLPTVESPRIKDADIYPIPPNPSRPAAVRFVVVPQHAGPLDLPAFRARSGDRSGVSKAIRLSVANIPTDGRTSAFLGGVGPFEVRSDAEPASVRVGETLDFRVKISGPAAWGSVRTPDLSEWISPTLKIEAAGDQLQASETPIRTFRYRLRPLKSGPVILPPIAVAAFDPRARRYATRATSSLTIRVEAAPRFDPAVLGDPPISSTPRGSRPGSMSLVVGSLAVVSGSALAALFFARRWRKARPADPRRLALELSNGLKDGEDEVEAARAVAEALTIFLNRVGGRAPGVLTPPEARAGFELLTDEPGLSAQAETLVTRCDRARYGGGRGEARGLISEGRGFFEALAEGRVMDGRKVVGPGEAVETAS
jgi:hypothetical protein